MAGAGLLCEKSSAVWFVLREKYCWQVADKPNEQDDQGLRAAVRS
jgi:hypothetical protein